MTTANYITGTSIVVFAGTSVLSAGNTTITIIVGTCTSSCGQEKTGMGMGMIFIPAPTLLDAAAMPRQGRTSPASESSERQAAAERAVARGHTGSVCSAV